MPASTATAQSAAKAAPELHDACPLCGYAFKTPQPKCNVDKACKRRQASRDGVAAAAERGDTATVQSADEVARRRESHRKNSTPPVVDQGVTEPTTDTPVTKVQLGTPAQERMVDVLLAGPDTGLRSGRAGHWLVIAAGEDETVVKAFQDALDLADGMVTEGTPAQLQAARQGRRTAETILGRIHAALNQ